MAESRKTQANRRRELEMKMMDRQAGKNWGMCWGSNMGTPRALAMMGRHQVIPCQRTCLSPVHGTRKCGLYMGQFVSGFP